MILKAGVNRIALPEPIDSFTARLMVFLDGDPKFNPGSPATLATMFRVTDLMNLHRHESEKKTGAPCAFAILSGDELFLQPTPDRDYYAVLMFHPPMREL